MKKIIAIVLVLMTVLSMTACAKKEAAPAATEAPKATEEPKAESALEAVKKAGKLVIATSPDFPPFEELTGSNTVEGIEIDVMQLICKELGVELVIEQMDFDSVLPGIQAGKFDVGVSGISVTEQRKQNALFTNPYCLAAQAIVVTEGSAIAGKADLTGKKVSVQTGTTAESFCMGNGYEVSSFAANSDAESALVTGKVDAWVIDDLTAKDMVDAYNAANEKKLVILNEAMTTEPYAFAFTLGKDDLVEEINKILDKLVADGSVASIFEKFNAPYTSPASAQ